MSPLLLTLALEVRVFLDETKSRIIYVKYLAGDQIVTYNKKQTLTKRHKCLIITIATRVSLKGENHGKERRRNKKTD